MLRHGKVGVQEKTTKNSEDPTKKCDLIEWLAYILGKYDFSRPCM